MFPVEILLSSVTAANKSVEFQDKPLATQEFLKFLGLMLGMTQSANNATRATGELTGERTIQQNKSNQNGPHKVSFKESTASPLSSSRLTSHLAGRQDGHRYFAVGWKDKPKFVSLWHDSPSCTCCEETRAPRGWSADSIHRESSATYDRPGIL